MEKFTPYEKLSKKKKRELNAMKRRDWGGLRPVTRKSENPKAYNRKKAQNRRYDPDTAPFIFAAVRDPALLFNAVNLHIKPNNF